MARPTLAQSHELERLEAASMALADILTAVSYLTIRLRQIHRRAPQLSELVNPGQSELALIVDKADFAKEALGEILTLRQAERRRRNRKE